MSTQALTKTVNKVKPKQLKNRLGAAIVSMILGIISAIFVVFAIVIEVVTYASGVGLTFVIIAGISSLVGFPLGLSAIKSSKGRGMAIAGITLTILPFLFVVIALVITIMYMFF
ncbi:hypothetical protein [Paenibacillus taichungensis]|uniref:hypothetical protein n=1 Tax=Paenibacillus taichungensis TaxID=484184 RepID=UPI002871D0F3|nr:hypothetical protein [Paenibacillus taichungensis]MDR9749405.1 hypothetical protein [Paenibacillus taichungensis]